MSGLKNPTEEKRSEQVVCAKCEHSNPHGCNVCEACGAHLHVVCHHCGNRNPRIQARCLECNHSLHRSRARSLSHRLLGKNRKITTLQLVLLLLGILIGAAAIVFLADMRLPQPESSYAPLLPTQFPRHA